MSKALFSSSGFEASASIMMSGFTRSSSTRAASQKELEQATSDQQTAEGALKAARDAVRVFGKTDAEIDQMIAARRIDPCGKQMP